MYPTTVSQGGAPGGRVASLVGTGGVGHSFVGEGEHASIACGCQTGATTEIINY